MGWPAYNDDAGLCLHTHRLLVRVRMTGGPKASKLLVIREAILQTYGSICLTIGVVNAWRTGMA